MKYYRNVLSQLKIYVTNPMSYTSKFSSYVTMISNFFIIIMSFSQIQQVLLDWDCFCSSSVMIKFLLTFFFHYFFTVLILLKKCFNKFKSSILTSKNNYWLGKFIINTNKFVSKNTRNMILIFL